MAINPDDLLIFEVREGAQAKKKKPQTPVQEKSTATVTATAPATRQPQQPAAAATPVQRPQPQPQVQPVQPQVQKPLQQQPQPQPKPQQPTTVQPQPKQNDIQQQYKPSVPEVKPRPQPQPPLPKPQAKASEINPDILASLNTPQPGMAPPIPNEFEETSVPSAKTRHTKLSASKSKKLAKGKNCTIHPWRNAYALCAADNLPYCYEDLMDYNGTYYCLDDMEKAATLEKSTTQTAEKYSMVNMISATLFILVFPMFVYSSYNTLLPTVLQLYKTDVSLWIPYLLSNFQNTLMLVGVLFSLISFLAGASILRESKSAIRNGTAAGVINIVVFGYLYLVIRVFYLAGLVMVSIFALVTLVMSKSAYATIAPDEAGADVVNAYPPL
jgi:hypothetical protein